MAVDMGLSLGLGMMLHGSATQALDANNDGVGALWRMPKTGNIRYIHVLAGTKTGTAPDYYVGLEGATTTRVPDGTYKNSGNAKVNWSNPTASTLHRIDLGSGNTCPVTKGDLVWATIRYNTGTIGASNFINILYALLGNLQGMAIAVGRALTAGTWDAGSNYANMALEYDDGTVVGVCRLSTSHSWSSSNSPKFRGTLWTPDQTCVIDAIHLVARLNVGTDFKVYLMEGTNATPLEEWAVDDITDGSTANPAMWEFPLERTLNAGTAYRFMIEPTTTTAFAAVNQSTFFDTATMQAMGFASSLKYTTATALGTYTDTNASFLGVFPRIREVTASTGGVNSFAVFG
jgi:hypothetical protein